MLFFNHDFACYNVLQSSVFTAFYIEPHVVTIVVLHDSFVLQSSKCIYSVTTIYINGRKITVGKTFDATLKNNLTQV